MQRTDKGVTGYTMFKGERVAREDHRHPLLKGLEGARVEITWPWGETQRGWIGQTIGPHVSSLILARRDSSGGDLIRDDQRISVRVLYWRDGRP